MALHEYAVQRQPRHGSYLGEYVTHFGDDCAASQASLFVSWILFCVAFALSQNGVRAVLDTAPKWEKLAGCPALRILLTAHINIPRENETDLLAEASRLCSEGGGEREGSSCEEAETLQSLSQEYGDYEEGRVKSLQRFRPGFGRGFALLRFRKEKPLKFLPAPSSRGVAHFALPTSVFKTSRCLFISHACRCRF